MVPYDRLLKRSEFLLVASKGRRAPSPGLVLQVLRREDAGPPRLGFTVTKKVGNSVVRNRTKRRLRAAARMVLTDMPGFGVDMVLIGRSETRSRRFALLTDDLRRSMDRLGASTAGSPK